jgi:hypothetical protein
MTPNVAYNHLINNTDYLFKITLISAAGNKSRAQDIKPSAIQEFFISDTLNNFYQQGYIVINNSFDIIERDTPIADPYSDPRYYNNAGQSANSNYYDLTDGASNNIDAGFLFRGEGRDILRVDIMPRLDGTMVNGLGSEQGRKFFYMNFDFAIYDFEEIVDNNTGLKSKKLYFWDLYYQLMLEKNVPFTTATFASTTSAYNQITQNTAGSAFIENADNKDRAIPTGIALKEFLKTTFPPNENYPIDFSINIPGNNDITNLSQSDIDNQNIDWDIGGTNIFFSTPANYKATDCVDYILSRHVSNTQSNFDQCFLQLDRSTRTWTFKSLSQYFRQAYDALTDGPGDLYIETIKIGGYTNEDGKGKTINYFTPANGLFIRIGTIKNFSFDSMSALHAQRKLVPYLVHSYDYENKQFQIDIERNGIAQAMKTYQQNYVNYMNSKEGSGKPPFANFAPGQLRYRNKNVNNVFSTTEQSADQRLASGRNEFLYASVFTNNLLSFRLQGSTHRQAGEFIGIDRDGAIPASKFDNKLLGIYIIIEVKHLFIGNEYYNDLCCIKVYNFDQLEDTYGMENQVVKANGGIVGTAAANPVFAALSPVTLDLVTGGGTAAPTELGPTVNQHNELIGLVSNGQ